MPDIISRLVNEEINVVFLGSFNPAIFSPEWLAAHDIIEKADREIANYEQVNNEFTRVSIENLTIECLQNRFSVGTSNISQATKVSDITQNILQQLPHTPIKACGINPRCEFKAINEEHWHNIGHTLAPKDKVWNDLFQDPVMLQVSVKNTADTKHSGYFNVTVKPNLSKPGEHRVFVMTNCHFNVPENCTEVGSAKYVSGIITEDWERASSISRLVAQTIISRIPE